MDERKQSQKQGWMTTGFSFFFFKFDICFFNEKYFELDNFTYIIFHKNNKEK